jgi:hypothetical protein
MLHRGGSDMDSKQVAGAWIVAVAIISACLTAVSHWSGSGRTEGAGAQIIYAAPVRLPVPRAWHEATGSLPAKAATDDRYEDEDMKDQYFGDYEIDLAIQDRVR